MIEYFLLTIHDDVDPEITVPFLLEPSSWGI